MFNTQVFQKPEDDKAIWPYVVVLIHFHSNEWVIVGWRITQVFRQQSAEADGRTERQSVTSRRTEHSTEVDNVSYISLTYLKYLLSFILSLFLIIMSATEESNILAVDWRLLDKSTRCWRTYWWAQNQLGFLSDIFFRSLLPAHRKPRWGKRTNGKQSLSQVMELGTWTLAAMVAVPKSAWSSQTSDGKKFRN